MEGNRRVVWPVAASLAVLAAAAPGASCGSRRGGAATSSTAAAVPAPAPVPAAAPAPAAPTFAEAVRPVLSARCTPCHFPGGKMYERMPFDRPETLSAHRDGVRRRLKGDDLETFEKWLATMPEAAAADGWKEEPGR